VGKSHHGEVLYGLKVSEADEMMKEAVNGHQFMAKSHMTLNI